MNPSNYLWLANLKEGKNNIFSFPFYPKFVCVTLSFERSLDYTTFLFDPYILPEIIN